MVKKRDFGHLREALERKRNEIFGLRASLDESWKGLQEGEVEYEESASKSAMSLSLEQLDERETREIEAIDLALRRIETGDYGICLSCGKSVSPGRLEAIPWTPLCTRCAAEREARLGGGLGQDAGGAASGIRGDVLSDYASLGRRA